MARRKFTPVTHVCGTCSETKAQHADDMMEDGQGIWHCGACIQASATKITAKLAKDLQRAQEQERKEMEQYERESAAREAKRKEEQQVKDEAMLKRMPKDFVLVDLQYPSYSDPDRRVGEFQMYLVEGFGWCITTLLIKSASHRSLISASTDRFYAVRVDTGQVVRIGHGPHVKAMVSVYVRASRQAALQKYLDLQQKGLVDANMIRDRISTRRAQGALRRGRFF